ncbi:hypothetical protein NL676_021696 [Syzygium grande]|nr:hypothetical protein NL676_021696 [Syzygium grande]
MSAAPRHPTSPPATFPSSGLRRKRERGENHGHRRPRDGTERRKKGRSFAVLDSRFFLSPAGSVKTRMWVSPAPAHAKESERKNDPRRAFPSSSSSSSSSV